MSMIKVKYRGNLAALTGKAEETLEALDVESLLKTIGKLHGRDAEKAARTMLIALNGESILLLKRYKTALNEGDAVNFFPLCAGG
jgi:molybdopterin converting factor small subunit